VPGFHFYGADLCLQVRERGLAVEALCFHNQHAVELPPDFDPSERAFAAKRARRLWVKTTCAVVDGQWRRNAKLALAPACTEDPCRARPGHSTAPNRW
jgi:hypothetical protein